jgi:hypothetical protein
MFDESRRALRRSQVNDAEEEENSDRSERYRLQESKKRMRQFHRRDYGRSHDQKRHYERVFPGTAVRNG